jgi:hypothetical protein
MQGRIEVGAVVRRVFSIYVEQSSVLMPAAAVVFVLSGVLSVVLISAGAGGALLAELITLVAGMLFTGMIVELVADVQDGRRDSSPGQLLRAVTPMLGQLIGVALLAGLGIVIGLVLFVIPGLILLTFWSVVAPVVVLERVGGVKALRRSRELVRGNGWQVFGVIVVLDVLVTIIALLIETGADSAGTGVGIVATVIVGVLSAPISALASAVLYFDLRGSAPAVSPAGVGGDSL